MISLLTFGVLVINLLPLSLKFILSACSVIMEHIWGIFPLPAGIGAFSGESAEEMLLEEKRFPSWFLCVCLAVSFCMTFSGTRLFRSRVLAGHGSQQHPVTSSSPLAPVLTPRQLGSNTGPLDTAAFAASPGPGSCRARSQQLSVNSFLPPPSRQISGKFQKIDFQQVASVPHHNTLSSSELPSCLSNKIWISAPGALYLSLGIVTTS